MGKYTEFLYLNEEEMIQAGALDSARCVDVLDEMFTLLGKGDYVLGGPKHNEHGIKISFPDEPQFPNMPANGPDRRFMAMVGYLGGRFNIAGEKWYGSNIANPSRGLPRSVLMVMLNDPDTCEPVALMSGNIISAVRTGAVPGVGVRYLARKNSEVIGLIGAGPIQKACLQGIMATAKNASVVHIYDINRETAEKFGQWVKEQYGIGVVVCNSMENAISSADIISAATSRLRPVVIKNEWLKKGSLIIFTGNGWIDQEYYTDCKLFFDNEKMHAAYIEDAYRYETPVEQTFESMMGGQVYSLIAKGILPPVLETPSLSQCACGTIKGRENDDERICLWTGGIPAEDLAWGYECYQRAKELDLGTVLKLWDSPYWT